jgi:hypothetical protein
VIRMALARAPYRPALASKRAGTPHRCKRCRRHRAVGAGRPGAGVVAFGPASAPRWTIPVNAIVRSVARRYVTTFEGFDTPWSHLAAEVPGLRVHRLFLGGAYLAVGRTETTLQAQ